MPLTSKGSEIHNQVMSKLVLHGWTLTRVVNQMNERRPKEQRTTVQNISNKLTRGTIKFSEILEIAEIIGLKIEWMPRDS